MNIGEGFTEFERYDAVEAELQSNGNRIREEYAMDLLARVGVTVGDTDKLQWSVLYNLSTGEGSIFAHRNTENILRFTVTAGDSPVA